MQKKLLINGINIAVIIIFILAASISCVPIEKLKYINDIDELVEPIPNPKGQKVILPYDKLSIQVFSIDDKTNLLLNSSTGAVGAGSAGASGGSTGYLVDESGNINYPFVGKINLGNLTTEQANIKFAKAMSEYLELSTVSIKFVDSNVTILGDVGNQGVFPYAQEKLTIYEALALGGGISRFGDRKNIILIRQEGDKIMHHKLDLTNSKIAEKEFYYVQSNDIIIVEPIKSSSWFNYNNSNFSTITSTFTLFFAFFTMFFRK